MAGDYFPNRYFPERYYPAGYYQGEAVEGSISASLSGQGGLAATLTYVSAPVVETPAGTTGGGGNALRFYRGRYRGELRRAIQRARRDLSEPKTPKRRKQRYRKVAKQFVQFDAVLPPRIEAPVPPDFGLFEDLRDRIVTLARALDVQEKNAETKQQELSALFDQYEDAARKMDIAEEEQAIVLILALAA